MVKEILNAAGMVEEKTFKETLFITPPDEPYAVYHDSREVRGADGKNMITTHDFTIELYSDFPAPEVEVAIEKAFDDFGIPYTKQERDYIESDQLYQVIYEFEQIDK